MCNDAANVKRLWNIVLAAFRDREKPDFDLDALQYASWKEYVRLVTVDANLGQKY